MRVRGFRPIDIGIQDRLNAIATERAETIATMIQRELGSRVRPW